MDDRQNVALLQGTLDLILLEALRWGPQHGYGISRAIAAGSRDAFHVDTGSLYPALHRLEKRRLVRSEWKLTENKQRAKYYRLTAAGKKQLAAERLQWDRFVHGVSCLMESSGTGASS
jgi:transcriptional regulator